MSMDGNSVWYQILSVHNTKILDCKPVHVGSSKMFFNRYVFFKITYSPYIKNNI